MAVNSHLMICLRPRRYAGLDQASVMMPAFFCKSSETFAENPCFFKVVQKKRIPRF